MRLMDVWSRLAVDPCYGFDPFAHLVTTYAGLAPGRRTTVSALDRFLSWMSLELSDAVHRCREGGTPTGNSIRKRVP